MPPAAVSTAQASSSGLWDNTNARIASRGKSPCSQAVTLSRLCSEVCSSGLAWSVNTGPGGWMVLAANGPTNRVGMGKGAWSGTRKPDHHQRTNRRLPPLSALTGGTSPVEMPLF